MSDEQQRNWTRASALDLVKELDRLCELWNVESQDSRIPSFRRQRFYMAIGIERAMQELGIWPRSESTDLLFKCEAPSGARGPR